MQYLERAAELLIAQPVLPASVLLAFLLVYSLISILGLIYMGMDAPDMDLDVEIDAGVDLTAGTGLGMATVKWLNLSRVPLFVWGACFILLWWFISACLWIWFDQFDYQANWMMAAFLSSRSAVIAIGLTKYATNPMTKWFEVDRYNPGRLIGQSCEVCTGKVDTTFGQARYQTDAAPLLLNVRTDGPELMKGTLARIIDFDAEKRVYTVEAVEDEPNE